MEGGLGHVCVDCLQYDKADDLEVVGIGAC